MSAQIYEIWRNALAKASDLSRGEEAEGVDFDTYHATSQFMLEAIFATLLRQEGLSVPVAVGPDLLPPDTVFGSNGRVLGAITRAVR